jgi:peptidoglycan/LPS O-acetylase OafA/YrhL
VSWEWTSGDDETGSPGRPPGEPERRQPRWGLRTLGFLGLALLAMVTALTLGGYTFGTLGSLLFGLIGAGYCSIKGLRVALHHDTVRMLLSSNRRR